MSNVQLFGGGVLEAGSGFTYFVDDRFPTSLGARPDNADPLAARESAKTKVLIVDDEKLIADTCGQIFEDAGLDARIAYDAWSALELLAEFRPDYLLTDVLMLGMNGVQLAIAARKMFPAMNILLFSGQAGISEILLEGQEQGYEFELLPKPLHPLKLLERFQK